MNDLKQIIKRSGLTRKAFAESIGIAERTLYGYLRDPSLMPRWFHVFLDLYTTQPQPQPQPQTKPQPKEN